MSDKSDGVVFESGAVYICCHFVSIKMHKHSKSYLENKARQANALNTHITGDSFNAMFKLEQDARKFGESL